MIDPCRTTTTVTIWVSGGTLWVAGQPYAAATIRITTAAGAGRRANHLFQGGFSADFAETESLLHFEIKGTDHGEKASTTGRDPQGLGDGVYEFVASMRPSTGTGTSSGLRVGAEELQRKNPIILFGHQHDNPVGKAIKTWVDGTKLMKSRSNWPQKVPRRSSTR